MTRIVEASVAGKLTGAERKAFIKQINTLISNTGKLETNKVNEMIGLLNRTKADVLDSMLGLPKGNFTRAMGTQIKREIEIQIRDFQAKATAAMRRASGEFAALGQEYTSTLIRSQGHSAGIFGIPPELVENAATRSADLIKSLSARQIGDASEIINRGVISGKSTFEVAKDLRGAFNKGLSRMETIARTETLGIHSQVQQAQMTKLGADTPGLNKQWITVMDLRTREDHRQAHLQIRGHDKDFNIGGEPMSFPRDPKASAKNIVNCRCTMIPDFSDVTGEPILSAAEMPPASAPLGGLAKKVAAQVRKPRSGIRR